LRVKNKLLKRSLLTTGIYIFILFYLLFLVNTCAIQNDTPIKNTLILFLGFTLLIIGIFISFNINSDNHIFHFWFISENFFKVILVFLMIGSFLLIPSITFSSMLIEWEGVKIPNLIRAVIFVIGCAYLPGSCIFNIILPNSTIHKRFGVESFLIKITLYPFISFITLGIVVLVLDQIGLIKELITIILILFMISLFFLDLIIQKVRNQKILKIFKPSTISKNTFIILLVSIGIILFSSGIILDTKYLIPGDSWVGIAHANYIGLPEASLSKSWVASWRYPLFWGYPTFALSVLSGLPFININVLLTPFLYLFVTTVYLFMKALLHGYKEKVIILSTIITITFSGLLNLTTISDIFEKGNISDLIFDGIIIFRYKSFGIFLSFLGLALFFIISKDVIKIKDKQLLKSEQFKIMNLGAIFLIISFMTYMFPLLFGLIILFIYCLIIKNQKKYNILKNLSLFLCLVVIYFIIFDISMNFYLSEIFIKKIFFFFEIDLLQFILETFSYWQVVYSVLFFMILFSFIIQGIFFIYIRKRKRKRKIRFRGESLIAFCIYIFFTLVFTMFLVIYIRSILNEETLTNINNQFVFYYLNVYLFPSIGLIGILGSCLLYFSYKKSRNLFLILSIWIIIVFVIASLPIFEIFLSDFPNIPTLEQAIRQTSNTEYNNMIYWFTRTWFYAIPAISILFVIGIMKFTKYLKKIRFFRRKIFLGKILKNLSVSILVFFSISNLIIAGIYWQNLLYNVSDEEAQTIGWITNNIPDDSSILMDARFDEHLIRTLDYDVYKLMYTVEDAYKAYFGASNWWWFISYSYDSNCNISLLNEFEGHQNILKFEDQNHNGHLEVNFNFNDPQENGTIEYYIYSTKRFNRLWGEISDRSIDGLHIWNGSFSYYNGIKYIQLHPFIENSWYHIKIDFECTKGNYKGLNQYEWRATINNTLYDHLDMFINNNQMDALSFNTAVSDFGWQAYLDIINFSWYPNFQVESFMFNTTYFEEYLVKNNINYYIHTVEDSWYKRNVESAYLNINDLINNYFDQKKFEFEDYIVYSTEI